MMHARDVISGVIQYAAARATIVATIGLIAASAAGASQPPATAPAEAPPPVLMKTQTGVEAEVIFSGQSDIEVNRRQTDTSENALFALMSVPAGLVMAIFNPLYIAAPVVGIAAIPAGITLKQQIETVNRVLDPGTFALKIAGAMVERLQNAPDIAAGTRYTFSIASYGLAARDGAPKVFDAGREVCLFVHGTLRVSRGGSAAEDRPFALTRSSRTPGLPPPSCQPFDWFASDGGEALRAAVTETAHVVGAWSAQARPPQ